MTHRVIKAAADLLAAGRRGAFVTIIETIGSTPRKAGAKMLVRDDGSIVGTVGGGCVEADLVGEAQTAMRTGKPVVVEVDLTARSADENDMLCGGRLKALVEPLIGEEKLFIFGGGHISQALAEFASRLDFAVTVTDDRPQFANAQRFPTASRVLAAPFEEQFDQLDVDAASSIVIVTRGHSHDELCMEHALRTPARYIALIGSRTKVAVFRKNLQAKGFSREQLDRVICPAGLAIGAETPEEIAISVVAQLVAMRRLGQTGHAVQDDDGSEPRV